ncbi:MAG TPA: tRNA lysidine(34) synthetase TilS [Thermodesulfobacteriota bacterium]
MAAGLLARVERALREGPLLAAGERCLVAVSGGADSVALLDLLALLAPRLGVDLVVGHVDHGLRGAEGRKAAALVERLAAERGLPYREARLPAPAPGAPMPGEAALRRARYAALARLARETGCGVVAVAHSRDDQAETVLLRLLRGTGLRGLGGMAPSRSLPDPDGGPPLRLVRPLLDVPRADLAARVAERGLPIHPDPTNADRRWLRNALRLDLLPPLRRRVNARLDEALAATAAIARDEEAVLAGLAEGAYDRVLLDAGPAAVRLSASGLAALPVALQRRVLRLAGSRAAPEAPAPSFAQVEAARRLVAGRRAAGRGRSVGGPVRWPGRVAVSLERGALEVAGRVPERTGRARPRPDRAARTGP